MPGHSHDTIADLTTRFTETFNRDDLHGVMAFFADDAFYDEFNGRRSQGKAAIRAAFEPQFRGDYGRIRFLTEDLFVDADAGKALIRWRCAIEKEGLKRTWRGLDILVWAGGLLREKHTYAKAPAPALD